MKEAFFYFLPCFYAFIACIGFCILFNIRGIGILLCALGGALGWFVYLASAPLLQSDLLQSLVAAMAASTYAEIMARVRKCPVTPYALLASLPLVPGAGIYYTMEHAISGKTDLFASTFLHTLSLAGALALGLLLVASLVRLMNTVQRRRQIRRGKGI